MRQIHYEASRVSDFVLVDLGLGLSNLMIFYLRTIF